MDKLKHGLGVHSESLRVEDLALEYLSIVRYTGETTKKYYRCGKSI